MIMKIKEKILPIKGMIEIFDKNGNLYTRVNNLVLTATRASILQLLFNDVKISTQINNNELVTQLPTNNNTRKMICGFTFGEGGSSMNINPSIVNVPYHNDTFALENSNFKRLPFLKITSDSGPITFENNGSYENLDEIINYSVNEKSSISKNSDNNLIQTINNTVSSVKYFAFNNNCYYCKSFNIQNNQIIYDNITGEIDYIINLQVENQDLIGETFSEIGLVIADCTCNFNNNGVTITNIDDDTVRLATRATFKPISLSTELLSAFTLKYHLFI